MKRALFICSIMLATLGLLLGNSFGALPGTGWTTGVQIQNIGTTPATISVSYYDRDTTTTYTYTPASTVAANASITILGNEGTGWSPSAPPSGFIGSAVVESDQPILAIVNENNGIAGAQYRGSTSTTATTVNVPLVKASLYGKSSDIIVQNVGTAATTVTVNYSGNLGTGSANHAIDPNKMWVFAAADTMGAGFLGAATVTSSGGVPIIAVSNEYISDPANANYGRILQAGNAFSSTAGTTKLYAPIQKKALYGKSTGLQVQNTGAGSTSVTVTWKDQNTLVTYTNTKNINAGASFTFFGADMPCPAGFLGSAVATSTTEPIVAIVNESYDSPAPAGQKATTYTTFNDNAASTTVYIPLQKRNLGANNTGLQIMNVGTAAANVTCTYYTTVGGTYAITKNVSNDGSNTWNNEAAIPTGTYGSAVCTSTQNIIGIVNEASTTMDVKNYEGFNG